MGNLTNKYKYKFNAVCPYYTMFPLEFPLRILKQTSKDSIVFDPFCGRGTTNFAAQISGINSYGFDSSPIAVSIAKAKLAVTTSSEVLSLMKYLLESDFKPEVPEGEFWEWAFHPETLRELCKLREGLIQYPETDTSIILRAILLGCLHGPLTKNAANPTYFSNQMPRTFASKPDYSVRYWKKNNLKPRYVDVRVPITKRVINTLQNDIRKNSNYNNIKLIDSRKYKAYKNIESSIDLVITSPPYYGMHTYVPDQWLRNWLIGGSDKITYEYKEQMGNNSKENFIKSLSMVWDNIYKRASNSIRMVIRFGGIASKKVDYEEVLKDSMNESLGAWKIYYSKKAGNASKGRRQANFMQKNGSKNKGNAIDEKDYFIRLN